jgi:hypothetical protein
VTNPPTISSSRSTKNHPSARADPSIDVDQMICREWMKQSPRHPRPPHSDGRKRSRCITPAAGPFLRCHGAQSRMIGRPTRLLGDHTLKPPSHAHRASRQYADHMHRVVLAYPILQIFRQERQSGICPRLSTKCPNAGTATLVQKDLHRICCDGSLDQAIQCARSIVPLAHHAHRLHYDAKYPRRPQRVHSVEKVGSCDAEISVIQSV